MDNERVYKMTFSSVYPMYIQKVEKKGRAKEELDTVVCWLTGYDDSGLQAQIEKEVDYRRNLWRSCREHRRASHAENPLS